jgi:two-component system phosphate regulon sensor histidine kinase PhoR
MLGRMDPVALSVIAAEAVIVAVLIGLLWARSRTVDSIGDVLDAAEGIAARDGVAGAEREEQVRRLRRRADEAEAALARRGRDLAYLADLVGVGIVRLSDDLVVEVANEAAHAFLGRPAGSMIGRTAIEAVGDHRIEAVALAARERGSASDEVSLPGSDARTLLVRARRSPILGVWLVLEDVAELRRLQRIRAEFIDNLSHELRTPITTIGLLAETLIRDADAAEAAGASVPPRMRERIGKLEVESGHMAQMVSEMLELARIESGGGRVHLDDVDLGEVARESVERLRPFAERQGVRLEPEVPAALPRVRGEASRLGQVFANLVHNAVKFSSVGGIVRVRVRAAGPVIEASVEDQGAGIPAADLPRIFERFYKADRARRKGGGTGLGLAIARHIVEGHGGEIRVTSVEGRGSTFTFTIPVATGPAAGGGPSGPASSPPAANPPR